MAPTDPTPPADESATPTDESSATTDESSATTGVSSATDEPTRRAAMERAATDAGSPTALTRRTAIRTTGGLTAGALGLGAGFSGSAAGNIAEDAFQQLSVSDDNRIVTEDGEPFVMRGLSIGDPKRLHATKRLRGKSPRQLLDHVTDNADGWHPRVVRVPARPADIGEHPMGFTGPEYEDAELVNPDVVADDRRKERPPQPKAFDEDELAEYMDEYYQPIVEHCRERGVYCVVDFHRKWHEQPPGEEGRFGAENHRPYSSEYTNYWARNTFSGTVDGTEIEFTRDDPASWGHVDQTWIDAHGHDTWEDRSDLEGTPFAAEHWQVNEALLEEAIAFWEEAGERFGDMDHVIFEPFSEPTAPGIWGPVEGCGAVKQYGLWDTYLDDFAGPIIEAIRTHYDGLLLVGVPGWCTSLQGLHWRSFADAGYEDVAVTWHNVGEQGVSQLHNWFNDAEYRSPEGVEEETGEELEDPHLLPAEDVDEQDCWGWERYESEGLQEAMEYHPVVVSEFGWEDRQEVEHWIYPGPQSNETTFAYGEPLLEELEGDARVSWIAAWADVRAERRLFEYPAAPEQGDLDLVDDSFYATIEDPDAELPEPCEGLPCEWELLGNPDSGAYLKERLAEHADDAVPFETRPHGPGDCATVGSEDAAVDGHLVCDLNGDEQYRDVDADGAVGQGDVAEFFQKQHRETWKQPEKFDYSGNGEVTHGDVVELFDYVALQ